MRHPSPVAEYFLLFPYLPPLFLGMRPSLTLVCKASLKLETLTVKTSSCTQNSANTHHLSLAYFFFCILTGIDSVRL